MVTMIRSDLDFILAQIKIAEADAAGIDVVATGLVPNTEIPWGLRHVDGSNNNLLPGQNAYGSADQPFPNGVNGGTALNEADDGQAFGPPAPGLPGGWFLADGSNTPVAAGTPGAVFVPPGFAPGVNYLINNNYTTLRDIDGDGDLDVVTTNDPTITNPRAIQPGDVVDADPRTISNLVVDQTFNNPAAVYKALQLAGTEPAELLVKTNEILTAFAQLEAAIAAAGGVTDVTPLEAELTAAEATAAAEIGEAVAADAAADQAEADAAAAQLVADAAAATAGAALELYQSTLALANSDGTLTPAEQLALDSILAAFPTVQDALDAQANATTLSATAADLRSAANIAQGEADGATSAVAAAQSALDAAVAANDALTGAASAEIADFEALLEANGIAIEASPTGDWGKATILIENVAPDAGLSAPFNGWMTLFGQFFDHGLDLVAKGGNGTVYIPLQPDDPLYRPGASNNFMTLTRATLDENGNATNKVTPFVDQNQTYTSNASHQVFLREYDLRDGKPIATGRLLNGSDASGGGLATWADVKAQARDILGIELNDFDIHDVPEVEVDAYGNFIPGANGFPQLVVPVGTSGATTLVEGNLVTPIRTADGKVGVGTAFLDDIAHNANPDAGEAADTDSATSTSSERQPTGTYDNELLDKHYITGDGRGNENIGLTAIHHVFHSEHNRQVDLIKDTVLAEGDLEFLNEWLDTPLPAGTTFPLDAATIAALEWNGERIFQAAKFPTEMQYQHLVFEEFARTVQPFVNVFNDYNGQLDPAILAEFAHSVYRFGHSMLTETVDRLDANNQVIGSGGVAGPDQEQIGLIEAFLNPVEYAASGIDAEAAAGAIAEGMTRQRGNEIDEFVTEALRNNLVGLPLDLAAINIARGRETNVPTLNEARADFFAGSGDSQVKPYANWTEFAYNLKNPLSIVNFIAAYGTHASITSATTVEAKRDAAMLLVLGDLDVNGDGIVETAPADRFDFLNATGSYAGGSLGGLNNVDFWIGGLAEKQMAFGGMLGTTFNFVFEVQLENLQNADRFYYLSRLANLNLTAQLENNKFADMIHRNTDATHLPGNVFKAMDYQLEVDQSKQYNADLGTADPSGLANGFDPILAGLNGDRKVIREDLDNDGDTDLLRFIGGEHVVLGGTEEDDILIGDEGDDTLWGDGGDDILDGGIGNDFTFGGDGNDIITDQFGDDEIRSGAGDDVVSAGQGINLIITDTGRDFVWAGDDLDEILLGQGDDFGAGGADEDLLVGGEGNDWLESGLDNGLMLGDNGDLIQGLPIKRSVDSPIIGHDILVSTGGNADFDAEQGDDVMVGGLGTDRFFGQFGFDWATYKNDPYGIEADMNNRQFAPPSLPASPGAILDRYAQTEALSGSRYADILRGDDEADLGAAFGEAANNGLVLNNALTDANVALTRGLDEFLGSIDEDGDNRFSGGNILLGGGGSDIIEGRGGNDLIDGNRWLNVRIEVMSLDGTTVLESVDGMAAIQERMFSGEIKVSQLRMVREIIETEQGANGETLVGGPTNQDDIDNVDIAQFSAARADYEIEGFNATTGEASDTDDDGFISVTHLSRDAAGAIEDGVLGADGIDKLKNIERLMFADGVIKITDHENAIATGAPTITGTLAVGETLTASATGINDAEGVSSQIEFFWQVELEPGSGVFTDIQLVVADELAVARGPTYTLTAAEAGLAVRAIARFKDGDGVLETVISAPTDPVGGLPGTGGGTNGDDVLFGTPNPDLLDGFGGNDTLIGLAGDDILDGGVGTDTAIFIGNVGEFTFERTPEGGLEVIRTATGEEDEIIGIENVVFVASQADIDPVTGAVTNPLASFTIAQIEAFADGLALPPNNIATAGDDVLVDVANNVFVIDGLGGDDEIHGLDRADQLTGGAGNDLLFGGGGADTLTGGTGSDIIDGGAGNDTATFTEAVGTVTFEVNGLGNLTVTNAAGDTDELVNVENIVFLDANRTLAQAFADAGVITLGPAQVAFNGNATDQIVFGSDIANTIAGAGGDDVLLGFGGADTLNGGAGRDQLNGGVGNDIINGGADDDVIFVNAGNGRDTINGGAGVDTLEINGNADETETFRIFTAAEAIAAGLNPAGAEIVVTRTVGNGPASNADRIALVNDIEEIVINGRQLRADTVAITGDNIEIIGDFTGTALALNTIRAHGGRGNDKYDVTKLTSPHRLVVEDKGGNNTLVGGRTQDILNLLPGTTLDQYTVTTNADGSVTYTLGTYSFTVTNDGQPTLQELAGSADDDNEIDDETDDTGSSGETEDNEVEDEDEDYEDEDGDGVGGGTGSTAVHLTGSANSDHLFSDGGDDTAAGGGNDDNIVLGAGNDTAFGDDGDDNIVTGAGDDLAFGGSGEDLILAGDGNDWINAGKDDDQAYGGAGNDLFIASRGDGDDLYDGGDGIDSIDLAAITDNLTIRLGEGGVGSATSTQNGTDTLLDIENVRSGAGNDTIHANSYANVLAGGLGNDTFVFFTVGAADGDRITDFQAGDKIDLSAIDADLSIDGTQGLSFSGEAEFAASGEVIFRHEQRENGDKYTVVEANIDGDKFEIELDNGHQQLTKDDFLGVR